MTEITIFVLAAFVGFEVISKVPTTLHTPLMSQTNAIHGIVVLGGFMVTDRMLGMFSKKPKPKSPSDSSGDGSKG